MGCVMIAGHSKNLASVTPVIHTWLAAWHLVQLHPGSDKKTRTKLVVEVSENTLQWASVLLLHALNECTSTSGNRR